MINEKALAKIKDEWEGCTRCPLHRNNRNYVHFRIVGGYPDADVLFIGEGPGLNEDRIGKPFVGESGLIMEDAIKEATVDSEELAHAVYVYANLVACRPCDSRASGNRQPDSVEISACRPRLEGIIKAVNPSVIVFLGRIPAEQGPQALDNVEFSGLIFNMPHPAYLLYNGGRKGSEYKRYVNRLSEIFTSALEITNLKIDEQENTTIANQDQ